jgi:hypothetical protein
MIIDLDSSRLVRATSTEVADIICLPPACFDPSQTIFHCRANETDSSGRHFLWNGEARERSANWTFETPADKSLECPNRVIRVALTVRRTLPVLPYEQTSAAPVGMPQRCQ